MRREGRKVLTFDVDSRSKERMIVLVTKLVFDVS